MDPVAAFALGLAGGLHCIGMCGPIAVSVGRNYQYSVGRISSYVVLGTIAGAGGSLLTLGAYEQFVSIICGMIMMILALLQLAIHWSPLPTGFMHHVAKPLRLYFQQLFGKQTGFAYLGIGVLNGLLPCGLVFSALFGAMATTSALSGALFMACFGVGTLPVMISLALGGKWLQGKVFSRYRIVLPVLALLLGGVVMVRGMGLGIPYLSPKPPSTLSEPGCCGTSTMSHTHSSNEE